MTTNLFRPLTERERGLVAKLAEGEFPGVSEIRKQLEACEARTIDDEGSFELRLKNSPKAAVRYRVPVELKSKDADGAEIHVLLHVVDGLSKEIEIYKDTPGQVLEWPRSWDRVVFGGE